MATSSGVQSPGPSSAAERKLGQEWVETFFPIETSKKGQKKQNAEAPVGTQPA